MMTTVKGEAVRGRVHALDETTSTLILRLAGREGRREGEMAEEGRDIHAPVLTPPSLPPSLPLTQTTRPRPPRPPLPAPLLVLGPEIVEGTYFVS